MSHNQPPPFVYFLFSRNNTESYVYLLQFKSYSDQRTPHRLPPQKHKLTTKQPKTQENTIIMVTSARCSPVASILMVSKIALCRTIDNDRRNTAMQIFYVQQLSLYFIYIYSTRRGSASSRTKCEFLSLLLTLFLGRCVGTKRTNHSCQKIIFLPLSEHFSSCFDLISNRGGRRHCLVGFRRGERERAVHVVT